MPYTFRKYEARVRDPNTGAMVDIDLLGSTTIGDIEAAKNVAVAVVTANGNVQVNRVVEAGTSSITDVAPIYVPQRFGAMGNGVRDDTAALQSAFNRSGAVIDGANQPYKITELELVGRKNLLICNFRFYHGVRITLKNCENITFRNCIWDEFQDNGIPNKNVQCVVLTTIHTGSEEWTEEHNWRMDEVCKRITFENCQFIGTHFTESTPSLYDGTKPHYNTGMCLRLEGVDGLRVTGCTFTQNRGNACVQQNCYAPLGDFEFTNNLFYLNGWGGIELYRNTGLPGHPTRVIQGNRFIGHGLGYIPWEYLERFPENERGVGTAVLLGGSTARVQYGPCFCAVCNNIFEDNNESSVEGWQWNPVKDNIILGNGVLQTAESVEEMREKYKISYPLYVRKNPSQNPIYMNQDYDQEFYPEGEIRSIENNTIARGYGTRNPIIIRGHYYEPIVIRNNTLTDAVLDTDENAKFVHFLKATFHRGLIWEGNIGMRPYFNECDFVDGQYGLDELKSMYKCTFGPTAVFDTLSKTDRFMYLRSGRLNPEYAELRDNDVSVAVDGKPVLGYAGKDAAITIPDPVFDIRDETGYTDDGYVFPGYTNPTIVDTGLSVGATDTDWTVYADTTTTGDNGAGDNSFLIRLITISDVSENISLQFGSRYRNQPYTYLFLNGYYGDNGRIDGSSAQNFLAVGQSSRFVLRHKSGSGKIEVFAKKSNFTPQAFDDMNRGQYDFTSGTAGTLRFGGSIIGSNREKSYYNGIMKDAQVFDTALSDAQISMLLVESDITEHTDLVPIYDIEDDVRYEEGVGLTMDGTFGIDTGVPILEDTNDFTIVTKFKFDDMTADGELPNFTFIPVFSAMSADMAEDAHTGHTDKGFDVGLSLQDGRDLSDTAAGGFIGFRRDWRYNNYVMMDNSNYGSYHNYEYTVVIVRKDNVITVYDDNLLVIGTLTGDYATTLLSGNLTIGARMGYGSGYTDFFKGVIRSFRVYDCAVPLRVIEKDFPSLDDNEASDKGAVTYYLTNKSHSYKLVRYAVVEITYDLGEFNRAEYEELYPQAFGIKMDGVYENATWIPCSASNKVRLIRLCKWDAICGPYESYKITIVNPGTVPGMTLKIKGIKAMLLSESETISEDSFDVTWKTDLDSLVVGGSVAGYISFTPKDAESRMTITASSEDTSVATITKSGSRLTVAGTGVGETDVIVSSTGGEVKVYRVVVSGGGV